jgi:hypothetical protein
MTEETKPEPRDRSAYERLMRRIAAAILALGLCAAAAVFVLAAPEPDEDYAGVYVLSIQNSKKYQLELQRIGGKSAVLAAEFSEWFDSLWHGRRLAATIAVLSVVASGVCWLFGKLPPLDD